jgi:hypothetical protein
VSKTDATFEPLARRLDHRDTDRRVVGARRIGVHHRLHAREVAGAVQAAHELVERSTGVEIAALLRAEVADEIGAVTPQSRHFDVADAKRRPARNLDRQVGFAHRGIDARFARRERGGGIGARRERLHRADLGAVPRRLVEDRTLRQSPLAPQLCDGFRALRIVALGRARHLDTHIVDTRRYAEHDLQRDRDGLRRAIDRDVDLRREVADGGDGLARFIDGVVREPVDEVVGHALERLPADEADALTQQLYDVLGRIDDDAIADRVGVRDGHGRRTCGRAGRRRGLSECGTGRRRVREQQRQRQAPATGRAARRNRFRTRPSSRLPDHANPRTARSRTPKPASGFSRASDRRSPMARRSRAAKVTWPARGSSGAPGWWWSEVQSRIDSS